MVAPSGQLEFTATSEDGRVLDTLGHEMRQGSARGEYVNVSATTASRSTSPALSVPAEVMGIAAE